MPADDLLERMIRDYGDALLRTCYLYLKDYHLAEDAVQETLIKAMKHYGGFRHHSDEKTWLTRIAINCCKNMKSCVSQGIMQLDPDDREILILFYYQELTLKEIASVIGRSENASMQRLSRARKRLKKILEGLS